MSYQVDEQNLERQRLLSKVLAPITNKLIDTLKLPSGIRGLDVGCGIGESTYYLVHKIGQASEFVGVDLDANLIEVANRLPPPTTDTTVHFRQGNVTQLEFSDQTFDFVFTRYLLHHVPNPEEALKEIIRVCKPGGIVAVQEPDLLLSSQLGIRKDP